MCRNVVPYLMCLPQMTSLLRPMALTSTEKLKLPENTSNSKNEAAMQASFRGRGQISPPPQRMVTIMYAMLYTGSMREHREFQLQTSWDGKYPSPSFPVSHSPQCYFSSLVLSLRQ